MKYEIFERELINYVGLKTEVNLAKIEESNIGEVWGQLFSNTDSLSIDPKTECIGLEKYPKDFMETKIFSYYALAPVTEIKEVGGNFHHITLPKGKYIKFPVIFKDLGPDKYAEVYKFIKDNGIKVDYSFDFELYPRDFDGDNPESQLFITLKLA